MTQSFVYVILPNELIGKGHEVLLHELNGLRYLIQMFKGVIELSKKVSFPGGKITPPTNFAETYTVAARRHERV